MSYPITHNILVSKNFKTVVQLLNNNFKVISNVRDFKYKGNDFIIELKPVDKKVVCVTIIFPDQQTLICYQDQHPLASVEKRATAEKIRQSIVHVYNIVGKSIQLSNITLDWNKTLSPIYLIYPQFIFELEHNLPGPNFMEIGNRFVAKFVLTIYDKIGHGKYGVSLKESTFYKADIILIGVKTIDGVEIETSSFKPDTTVNIIQLLPEYVEQFSKWLFDKSNILDEFKQPLIETIQNYN